MKTTFSTQNINTPPPLKWKRISDSVKYFLVSLIAMEGVTDMLPEAWRGKFLTITSLIILVLKTIDMGLGQNNNHEENK